MHQYTNGVCALIAVNELLIVKQTQTNVLMFYFRTFYKSRYFKTITEVFQQILNPVLHFRKAGPKSKYWYPFRPFQKMYVTLSHKLFEVLAERVLIIIKIEN